MPGHRAAAIRGTARSGSCSQRPGMTSENYCAATLLDFCARSRSITVRQPVLRLARFFIMQAVIFGIFGISSLQS